MIGKVKIGKSFPGICRYVLQEDRQARVLDAEGVRTDSAAHMAQDFQFQQGQRPGLGNAVLHVALALPAEDASGRSAEQLSELLREAGRAYVRDMQLENTQWALVQHFDKKHPHAHLVVNRVDNNGQTIADNFIGQQSRRVCQDIEQQLGLTVAEQRGREQAREVGPTHRQAVATTPKGARAADWQRARHEVATALGQTAPYSASFAQLQTRLAAYGIEVKTSVHQKKAGPAVYGVVFEKDGHQMKGSEVGKAFSAGNLQKTFAQHQTQAPELAQVVSQAAQGYSAEALNRLFAQQAQEMARQPTHTPTRQRTPGREQSGGLEM
ncbi:relaxase/mobilization nuclease domain-containing protein [Hymenobacter sp. NST-14]|uniref:relaxase/mobilization nuclease domain-containing protein n=1 Tax=Hymenobacter piscis TaxID=2839984 RepID=UPI001C032CEC|nr:relaxase/mobilization nuclease domain-containing protein [Hymenobacter piscis]MBT9395603.1 relaxase/mobilization nuclease domain-containing protein [Hymenobacter piscis]